MTPGRLLWLTRRDWRRGWSASWHDYVTRPRIHGWRNPHAALPVQHVAIHIVAGDAHSDMALWMLAGFFHHTGRNWRVVLHDDGKLSPERASLWERTGLQLEIISREEADLTVKSLLYNRPLLRAYRETFPLGLKLIDVPHRMSGRRGLLLDADLIFFRQPTEILDWVDGPDNGSTWFNADVQEASNIPEAVALSTFGIKLWPRVNSGLGLLAGNLVDLDFCESVLKEGTILQGRGWRVEQTLFALSASQSGSGGLLPATYEVSLGRSASKDCVVRHYVGAVRDLFWSEGVGRLSKIVNLP
jgi:hypothetical protein